MVLRSATLKVCLRGFLRHIGVICTPSLPQRLPTPSNDCLFLKQVCEILVPIAFAQKPPINVYTEISSEATGLNFGLSLHLHPLFVFTGIECSGETAHMLLAVATSTDIPCTGPYIKIILKILTCS